jgi:hypothetical protein
LVLQVAGKLESIYGSTLTTTSNSSSHENHVVVAGNSGNGSGIGNVMKMTQSPSLDEMKQKMGKLFHKPSGNVTQFWKKS